MVAALRRLGGNLWMVDNAYTGAYVDNVGTTPVTAYADLLGLTTDRLGVFGPELAGLSSAWQSYGTGISLSGGQMTFTASPRGQFALRGTPLGANKTYALEITIPSITGGGLSLLLGGGAGILNITTAGTYRGIYKATSADGPYLWVASGTVTAVVTVASCKEITGSHATQSAVASKPSVQRVPKRTRGPVNQLTQSDVSQWSFVNASGTATRVGNQLTFGASAVDRVLRSGNVTTAVGQALTVAVKLSGAGSIRAIFLEGNGGTTTAVGTIELTGTPTYHVFPVAATTAGSSGGMGIYNNAAGTAGAAFTVHEAGVFYGTYTAQQIIDNGGIPLTTTTALPNVLEWATVISFDGNNDFLQTGITTGNEGFVAAAVTFGGAAGANETVADSGGVAVTTNKGFWLFRCGNAGANWLEMRVGNGTAVTTKEVSTVPLLGVPRVVEGGWDASNVHVGVDGVVGSKARTGDASPSASVLRIGGYQGAANYLNGPMHAIAYTPVLPDAATRKIIINGLAALQGRGPL